jgi:hypothetical protein
MFVELDREIKQETIRSAHSMPAVWLVAGPGRSLALRLWPSLGTHSAREAYVPAAFTRGIRHSVLRVLAGQRTPNGMPRAEKSILIRSQSAARNTGTLFLGNATPSHQVHGKAPSQ